MRISELMKGIEILEKRGYTEDIEIADITVSSREVRNGFLFTAIKGHYSDGHMYLKDAEARGAACAVVESPSDDIGIPQLRVADTRRAHSRICSNYYGTPSAEMRVFGITATNGKTTTSYMLDSILEERGNTTGLFGSVRIKNGKETIPSSMTTPDARIIQASLRKMKDNGVEKVTMEVSSSSLEQHRVADIEFDIVAFNNFSREHIDQHGSLEKYFEAKSSLITDAGENAYAVLNYDDPYARSLIGRTHARVITYSVSDAAADIYCSGYDLSSGKASMEVVVFVDFDGLEGRVEKGTFHVELGVPGYHSITNALSVIAMALIDGTDRGVIANALKRFTGVERRFQYVYDRDFVIADDHFANSRNIDVTLESISRSNCRKLHIVYAIRGNRGTTVNRENIETLLKWKDSLPMDEIIGTLSEGLVGPKDEVKAEEIEVYFDALKGSGLETPLFGKLEDAIAHAIGKALKGDMILLAGSQGMDYGAEIALKMMRTLRPEIPEDELLRPLKDRTLLLENLKI
ncbi:Mur ligase family protein [Youngiibacter fragilis]|uniref:UDP-N-acetylmuramyl peptide synthase n=1 Tax=Youngiibacter fragilis 232.1 TaxID=994573 RepID=V7I6P3_9CLOT|nr:Mur ligase family protein [Youngiibacter fragilis]ETA80652.1 UDP-N-acetylmuramyl peptide synthase [Youngiibacter fragilis 232.1]